MEILNSLFSIFCGQGRCFVIDGQALPVCQRCFGLYAGAALTGLWLWLGRPRRRGLPSLDIVLVHSVILLTAMVAGLHLLDFGPRWRLLCGAGTGHVITLWLSGATVHLNLLYKSQSPPSALWRRRDKIEGLLCVALITLFAWAFDKLTFLGWHFYAGVVIAGAFFLTVLIVRTGASLILNFTKSERLSIS